MTLKNICITGPDGSGKTTLIKALLNKLPDSSVVSIWDILFSGSFELILPFKHPLEIDKYLSKLHHESRSLFLMHCLWEALAIAADKKTDYIITDGYWYKYYATELVHGSPRSYLDKIVSIFNPPDYLFYIDADESLTAMRKDHYSNYECGFSGIKDANSFVQFQNKSIRIIKELMHAENAFFLDPQSEPELLADKIHQIVNEQEPN